MKFLHLADLHLGKTVNGFSMLNEQQHAFAQILHYISTEQPQAVVIAGDVYDRAVPSVEAVKLLDDFITGLCALNVCVLIISGNHDSPERLNFASRLLTSKGLFLYGAYDGAAHNVPFMDEHGEINFWLLPFIKPLTARTETYGEAVASAIEASGIDWNARNVLVSHQFYTGTEMDAVGGLDAVDAKLIRRFDYAALGHLHTSQRAGYEHARYCGSPVKYSFANWRLPKTVSLVEVAEKGSVSVTQLPITPLYPMREVKGRIAELTKPANASEDYLHAILTDDEELINPMDRLRAVYPNLMTLDFENTRTRLSAADMPTGTGGAQNLSPYELFCEFFLETMGSAMSAEQEAIIRETLEAGV